MSNLFKLVIFSGVEAQNTIEIESNEYLGRLDLIRLRSVKSRNSDSDARITSNEELCIDPSFIQLLAQSNIRYINQYSPLSYCELDKINNPSTYCTGKLSTINERCTRYIGDIIYSNPDIWDYSDINNYTKVPQNEIKKFQQFEIIFGSFVIEGSTLTNISMPNLREIYQVSAVYIGTASLGLGVAMKFRRNDFLKEVSFPNLKISHNSILLYRNGNLTTDADFCKKMTDGRKRMTLLGLDSEYDCRPYL
ncbi:hypothetical protein GCK72_014387 [Caenorhabditis remanei]|uniref:Receptor L-domain domain-containing protein n=1 Tax=Caenorhabditis remanei TaxID=31234 RepID=A0A6A5GTT8_CAERE|nr:hypothetical protein GCK72_014387 [Caenorhabditis remanei]KAF1757929.1 hypothetical protein GCK72_014387 [Caenorhabditis remanei]